MHNVISKVPNLPKLTSPFTLDTQISLNPPLSSRVVTPDGLVDRFTPALEAHILNKGASTTETVSEELVDLFADVRKAVELEAPARTSRLGDNVVVTTLGTGSALPSKYRNGASSLLPSFSFSSTRVLTHNLPPAPVLSNLIQIPTYGSILLDTGEGTWGQIARRFGTQVENGATESPAMQILRDLRCVFISHIHGDHHMGLAKILSVRRQVSPLWFSR